MAEAKIFPKGITFFAPRENAPTWVKGSVIVNANEFFAWMQANKDLLKESEKYGKQFKFIVTDKGMQVDTWKPTQQAKQETKTPKTNNSQVVDDDLPF
jgi:hypothetical protein